MYIKVKTNACVNCVEKIVNKYAYGVKVFRYYDGLYFVADKKSGLTKEGKELIKKYFPKYKHLVDKNQMPLIILMIIAFVAVFCSVNPNHPMCKGISATWWNVLLPLISLAIGFSIGSYMGGGK